MKSGYIFLNKFAGLGEYNEYFEPVAEYQSFVRFFETGIIDRTETIQCGFPYHTLDPIPSVPKDSEKLSLKAIIKERANEAAVLSVNSSLPLNVLWSGGIDSTVALISLIKELGKKDFSRMVAISITVNSIHEFPELFKYLLQLGFNFRKLGHPVSKFLNTNELHVTGEHGDQLFGSDKMLQLVESECGDIGHDVMAPLLMMDKLCNASKVDSLYGYIQPIIDKSPFEIITICDYMWWINFVCKWQQVSLRIPVWKFNEVKQLFDSTFHFFRSSDFQTWSMQKNSKNPGEVTKYKIEFKEYIAEFFDCKNYFNNKTKEISLKPRNEKRFWDLNRNKWAIIIDENWNLKRKHISNYIF